MADSKPEDPKPRLKLEKQSDLSLPAAVLALDLAPDGLTAYAACQDGGVYQAALDKTAPPRLLGRHESYASGVALLPGGRQLLSAGYDGALLWHDIAAGTSSRRVQAHQFWSWGLDLSPDGRWAASVTGRYEAGGMKYEPAPEREPSLKIFDAATGALRHSLPHVPPTQAVAFSPDSRHVAAGNLMGEVRVWEVESGKQVSSWTTPDLTSWGVIKSHHYLGGMFDMLFAPDGQSLLVCGMGPMVDPMAGNGVQRWQRFDWKSGRKLDQTHDGESGQGLMEALAFHPGGKWFVMAGRLFQGQWNLAAFDAAGGTSLFTTDAKHRITDLRFTADGASLLIAKARQQEKKKDGRWPDYGSIEIWKVATSA